MVYKGITMARVRQCDGAYVRMYGCIMQINLALTKPNKLYS